MKKNRAALPPIEVTRRFRLIVRYVFGLILVLVGIMITFAFIIEDPTSFQKDVFQVCERALLTSLGGFVGLLEGRISSA